MRSGFLPCALVAFAAALAPRPAEAIPVFAHRYGLQCQACHTVVPHLTPFGETFLANGSVSLQPTGSLNLSVDYNRSTFDHTDTGERVYTVDVINARTTYQFDRRLALRAIVQYDSSLKQILTDLLASFELVPGTVAFVGYGSLYERREWESDVGAAPTSPRYLTSRRGLFFKVSYAHRF